MAQWALTYYQFVAGILLTVTPLLRNKPAARKHRRAVVPARRWGRIATGYVTNLRAGRVTVYKLGSSPAWIDHERSRAGGGGRSGERRVGGRRHQESCRRLP